MQCNSMQGLYSQLTGEDLCTGLYDMICIYIYIYIHIYIYIYRCSVTVCKASMLN